MGRTSHPVKMVIQEAQPHVHLLSLAALSSFDPGEERQDQSWELKTSSTPFQNPTELRLGMSFTPSPSQELVLIHSLSYTFGTGTSPAVAAGSTRAAFDHLLEDVSLRVKVKEEGCWICRGHWGSLTSLLRIPVCFKWFRVDWTQNNFLVLKNYYFLEKGEGKKECEWTNPSPYFSFLTLFLCRYLWNG